MECISFWVERCTVTIRKLVHAIYRDFFRYKKLKLSVEKELIVLIYLLKTLIRTASVSKEMSIKLFQLMGK